MTTTPQGLREKYWYDHPTWAAEVRPKLAPLPTPQQMQALGKMGTARYLMARHQAIELAKTDPLWHGFVPPVWELAWRILDVPWVDPEAAEKTRQALGMAKPRRVLLANGANRAGKTEFAACTCGRFLWPVIRKNMTPATVERMTKMMAKPRNVYCFLSTEKDSRDRQQPYMLRYMPAHMRALACSKNGFKEGSTASIKYSVKNGFADDLFVTPDGSKCDFRNYAAFSRDPGTVEGIEADVIWPDELASAELLETLRGRIATRGGILIPTFTPINGYSPAVRMFYQGSHAVLKSPAFLLPEDGGAPDLEAAMYTEDVIWRLEQGAS